VIHLIKDLNNIRTAPTGKSTYNVCDKQLLQMDLPAAHRESTIRRCSSAKSLYSLLERSRRADELADGHISFHA
jgi:hypothetical protein